MKNITVVGLGPGDYRYITNEAARIIESADCLILRTAIHPTVEKLKERNIKFETYDDLYEKSSNFDELYEEIATDLIRKADEKRELVYAVPGSPLVAEKTVTILRDKAKEADISLNIIPGMSFFEIFLTRLGVDPICGVTIMDANDISLIPVDFPTSLIVTQIYDNKTASDAKLSLMEIFPDEYEIIYAHRLGCADESIRKIPLFELDRQKDIDYLTSVYVPKKARTKFDLSPLTDIMRTLREPGGCPWDRKQTPKTLRQHILEEAYEVVEAIDLNDNDLLTEELGDLLLQIVFQARIAEEMGNFTMQDVINGITDKLVRRHPHIFGDIQVADAEEVLKNWEAIKREEKPERVSAIDGIPKGMSALLAANKLQKKAADVGFDFENLNQVLGKCAEELDELKSAISSGKNDDIVSELGDMIFSIVNLSRFLKVNPETALLESNEKFSERFRFVEDCVNKAGGDFKKFSMDELDSFWEKAKANEK